MKFLFCFKKEGGILLMYTNLINKLASKIAKINYKDLEMLEDIEKDISNYVKIVTDTENSIKLARFRLEGQDFRDYVSNLDFARRMSHNSAIASVKALNRICSAYEIDNIFKGNLNDRIEIGNFCKKVVDELFLERAV